MYAKYFAIREKKSRNYIDLFSVKENRYLRYDRRSAMSQMKIHGSAS